MFVFHWFSIQWNVLKNDFKKNPLELLGKDLWHSAILLFGLAVFYFFLHGMFDFVMKKNWPPFEFAFILLSLTLLIFLPLIFYSAILCALSYLFVKEEIQFYFSLPVKRLAIFTIKFLQTYFHTIWMVFLGLFTFLLAIQQHFQTTPLVFVTGSLSLLFFFLIPVCLALMVVILISRFFPFVQAKGMLAVIGLLVGSVLLSAIRVMQPERLFTVEGKTRLVTFMQYLHQPWMSIFPSEWVTNIIFAQVQKDWRGVWNNCLSLFILTTALVIVVYILAGLFYERAWADAVVTSPIVQKRTAGMGLLRIFSPPVRALIQKDLLSLYRDTLEKGSLLILLPISFVYLYSLHILYRYTNTPGIEPIFSFLYVYLFNFFYSSVVVSGLSGRWVFPSISSERNNFKLIKNSPTQLKDFLKAKFLLGFIPLLLIAQILVLSSSLILHLSFPFVLVSICTIVLLCWGITMISLNLGVRHADFSILEPLDFAVSYKGFVCLVGELIFVGWVLVLVGIPTALFLYQGFSSVFIFASSISLVAAGVTVILLNSFYQSNLAVLLRKEI